MLFSMPDTLSQDTMDSHRTQHLHLRKIEVFTISTMVQDKKQLQPNKKGEIYIFAMLMIILHSNLPFQMSQTT